MTLDSAVVVAYWRHCAKSRGDRAQRLASDEDFWAWETVQAALDSPDPLPVLDAVLGADQADPCYLGAGPVEDLLASDPERWDGSVAERCRRDRKWREAVACVWLDDNIRSRLVELRSYLPINR